MTRIFGMTIDDIISAIAKRREELHLSQATVAERAGISRETYSRFETGKQDIGLRRLMRICGALGMDLIARPGSGRPTVDDLDALFGDDDDE